MKIENNLYSIVKIYLFLITIKNKIYFAKISQFAPLPSSRTQTDRQNEMHL